MDIIVNKEEMKKEWVLGTWYEKVYYVHGMFWTWLFALSFVFGFLSEVLK